MLFIYDLITRATDTGDDSWIDRFVCMTYDDLLDSYDMAPRDAAKKAARDFDDDAHIILQNWESLRVMLIGADETAAEFNDSPLPDYDGLAQKVDSLDGDSTTEELVDALADAVSVQTIQSELLDLAADFSVADYLESFECGDGTLYDFFTRTLGEVNDDITSLYRWLPLFPPASAR